MPTNRKRVRREGRSRVSDEARAVYKMALTLRDTHDAHTMAMCPTPVGTRCADCLKYSDLRRELGRLIGLSHFLGSPLSVDSAEPPDYMRENPWQAGLWRKAWAIRCELESKQ